MYNKHFCKNPENIENYEKAKADNFKGWHCHHWYNNGKMNKLCYECPDGFTSGRLR